ncbi:hypothetical protein [Planctomycetes bacterium K23_9]|uniref:Uncharacterized protein n=1 Tax=Stieleria marina TaxID=1930275 RepID=A0A517P222_9BACT|nr:hypothetical protein K239x_54210 [Planctomycetes bacterium K23_9]
MDERLSQSFAKTAADLRMFVEQNCPLPNPESGFSLFLRSLNVDDRTGNAPLPPWPSDTNFKYPQTLACFGFLLAIDPEYQQRLHSEWPTACESVLSRDLFPIDRQSFTFRPIEVLGIAYGIKRLAGPASPLHATFLATVRNCLTKANDDVKSRWLYRFAEMLLDDTPCEMPRLSDDSLTLDVAATVKWLAMQQSVVAPIDPDLVLAVEDKILKDVAIGKFEFQNAADATILLSSLEHSIERRLRSRLNETSIVPATNRDALRLIERLCRNFPLFARQLQKRRKDVKQTGTTERLPRSTIEMVDEYDVQDAFHAILRLFFDDVRAEPWTPSYAGNQNRIDFVLPDHKIAIEVKHTGSRLTQRHVADQLIIDSRYYRHETDYTHLICFVYDPELRLKNAVALEKDLASEDHDFSVSVVVCPQGK